MSPTEFDAILQAAFRDPNRHSVRLEFTSGTRLELQSLEKVVRQGSIYVVTDREQDRHYFVAASVSRIVVRRPREPLDFDLSD
jgi:hypothetical protein